MQGQLAVDPVEVLLPLLRRKSARRVWHIWVGDRAHSLPAKTCALDGFPHEREGASRAEQCDVGKDEVEMVLWGR